MRRFNFGLYSIMTTKTTEQIEEAGYDAYFFRGEKENDNPYVWELEPDAHDSWELGRQRAESDCG